MSLKVSEVSFGPESKIRFHDDGTLGIVVEREKIHDVEGIKAEVQRLTILAESLQTTKGPELQELFTTPFQHEKPGDKEAGKALIRVMEKIGFTALQDVVKKIRAGEATKEGWISSAERNKIKRKDALVIWKFAQKGE